MVEEYTSYTFAYPMKNHLGDIVIKSPKDIFCLYDVQALIHSDQRALFMTKKMSPFCDYSLSSSDIRDNMKCFMDAFGNVYT